MLQISNEIRKATLLNTAITGFEALTAAVGGNGADRHRRSGRAWRPDSTLANGLGPVDGSR